MAPRREVTIAHGLFTHGPRNKIALRGATIEVDEADYERGMAHGAFVTDGTELEHHGALPAFDFDPDDTGDIDAWMRSAAPSDVAAALAAAAAEGRDVSALMLAGEKSRGSEARPEVLHLLAQSVEVADPDVGDDRPGADEDVDEEPAEDVEGPASDRIDDIVTWVGDDQERAATALKAEQESKGDDVRPRLVKKLEEILGQGGDE